MAKNGDVTKNRIFSDPSVTIVSFNVEGLTRTKEELLSIMCKEQEIEVLCLQETHRDEAKPRPRIYGMALVAEIPHGKYGSAIFTKTNIMINSIDSTHVDDIEIITVELSNYTVTSVYKPPNKDFHFQETNNFHSQTVQFIVGDFNSHSTSWGYRTTDDNGHKAEEWAERNDLTIIHDHKLPCSFYSRAWRRGYNPDLCWVSSKIAGECIKTVHDHIPKSQHRPIGIKVYSAMKTTTIAYRRRFNFKKANWEKFSRELDIAVANIPATPQNYNEFVKILRKISRKNIPRGCQQQYIPGISPEAKELLVEYQRLYSEDPFKEETIELGERVTQMTSMARQNKWMETLERLDMTHSSKVAWNLIKKLSGDPCAASQPGRITPNMIAHQLLINGKTKDRIARRKIVRERRSEHNLLEEPITMKELDSALENMKNGKAPGIDDICTDQIKHFGPETKSWLIKLFNTCLRTLALPKSWRKSKVIALLKPGKSPDLATSYRPISLLCHLHKIYERIIFQRIQPFIEEKLIPQQAGFRPGKCCTSQILNLTEHIEAGYEEGVITGIALIDLSAAYDTVNHNVLMTKLYNLTQDFHLVQVIQSLLQNRRFYVRLNGKSSRWRNQINGLAQGSVLAPLLFNVYTNDQPIAPDARHFLYADDLAIAIQSRSFQEVEQKLTQKLAAMSAFYRQNSLKPNPSKTQLCAFHLRSREARRKLNVQWEGQQLEHTESPKYLGVTLDRTLTFKTHCQNTASKVNSRNNIIKKLRNSKWGASPKVLLTSGKALSFSVGEYACPVWCRSTHSKKIDVALNETCRIMTGCMKPTPTAQLYKAAGVAAPNIRRATHEYVERFKQTFDERHMLYGTQEPPNFRLKSRRNFLKCTRPEPPEWYPPDERAATGVDLDWKAWKTLNRIRTGVAPVRQNLARWGFNQAEETLCDCGDTQTMRHLLQCPLLPTHCTLDDLWKGNNLAADVARYWAEKI